MDNAMRPADEGKNRITSIDIARALAMFLAVLGHILTDGAVRQAVYSFHVPLFFMVSGMTLRFRSDMSARSWVNLLIKKLCVYYVPYLIWALVCAQHSLRLKFIFRVLYGTHESLSWAESQTALWYLPALFTAGLLAELAMALIFRAKNKRLVWFLSCTLLLASGIAIPHLKPHGYPVGLDVALIGAGFMLLGYAARKAGAVLAGKTRRKLAAAGILTGIFTVLFLVLPRADLIYLCEKDIGNPLVFLLLSVAGSLMMLALALLIDTFPAVRKPMAFAGRYTLIVLAIHKPMKRALISLAGKTAVGDRDILLALGAALVTFVLATLISYGISVIAPALAGKGPVPQIPEKKEKAA